MRLRQHLRVARHLRSAEGNEGHLHPEQLRAGRGQPRLARVGAGVGVRVWVRVWVRVRVRVRVWVRVRIRVQVGFGFGFGFGFGLGFRFGLGFGFGSGLACSGSMSGPLPTMASFASGSFSSTALRSRSRFSVPGWG